MQDKVAIAGAKDDHFNVIPPWSFGNEGFLSRLHTPSCPEHSVIVQDTPNTGK
jgi:hypothetical protein